MSYKSINIVCGPTTIAASGTILNAIRKKIAKEVSKRLPRRRGLVCMGSSYVRSRRAELLILRQGIDMTNRAALMGHAAHRSGDAGLSERFSQATAVRCPQLLGVPTE